jgi:hypothetical protein
MALNIIIKNKRTEREKVIEQRGKDMMRHFYGRELEGENRADWCKVSKTEARRAWADDAKGDIDPAIMPP